MGAVTPGTDLAESFGTFGARSLISYPLATLYGSRSIHIGEGTLIGPHTTMSVGHSPHEQGLPSHGLVIGDRCVIGARATITAHESITLGHDVWLGQNVFISDASHGYQDPETPIGRQLGDSHPVSVGAGSWIGHGAILLPGAQIGRQVVVAAGSVVRGRFEDHVVVAGVPAKVVRRLEAGTGWVATNGSGDVRPAWTAEEVAAMFAGDD